MREGIGMRGGREGEEKKGKNTQNTCCTPSTLFDTRGNVPHMQKWEV